MLLVFKALSVERDAARAGGRLGLSQSAVSHSLARLRERLGDELFVKGADGMVPTACARAVAPRIHVALAELKAALADASFDPAASEQCFTIAADPYTRAVLLPSLIAFLRQSAPGVEVRIKPGSAGMTDALDSGEVDFAIASYSQVPERFGVLDIFEERHVWALRQDHSAAANPLTLDGLADLPHLIWDNLGAEDRRDGLVRRAIEDDAGAFARALAGIWRQRTVRLAIEDSYAALAMVGASDLAALVPERMGKQLAGPFRLRLFDPPYPSPPVRVSVVWELGRGANPAANWLLSVIDRVAEEMDQGTQPQG